MAPCYYFLGWWRRSRLNPMKFSRCSHFGNREESWLSGDRVHPRGSPITTIKHAVTKRLRYRFIFTLSYVLDKSCGYLSPLSRLNRPRILDSALRPASALIHVTHAVPAGTANTALKRVEPAAFANGDDVSASTPEEEATMRRVMFSFVPIVNVELHENMEFAYPPSIPPSSPQRT